LPVCAKRGFRANKAGSCRQKLELYTSTCINFSDKNLPFRRLFDTAGLRYDPW
jgi:hypothetical protein